MLMGAEVHCHACGEGVWCWGNDDEGGGEWATEGREEVLAENLVLLERCWVFGAWARMKCAGGVGGGAYGVGFWRCRRFQRCVSPSSRRSVHGYPYSTEGWDRGRAKMVEEEEGWLEAIAAWHTEEHSRGRSRMVCL